MHTYTFVCVYACKRYVSKNGFTVLKMGCEYEKLSRYTRRNLYAAVL